MAAAAKTILLLSLMALATAKPIMVKFGTYEGPIEPPTEKPQKPAPRTIDVRAPAPVSEETEDVPNPHVYRPPVPHQYRNRIFLQKPPTTLILGTPIDRKYTPSEEKFNIYKKQGRTDNAGTDYTGPHTFDKQEYEIIEARKPRPTFIKPHYYEQKLQQQEQQEQKSVPQIGIIYSAGVRYYVPQLVYVDHRQEEDQENSVYDSKDEKYFYRAKGQ